MMDDMRDYVKKYGKLILLSLAAAVFCFGFLVFCGNIRIDTEELINHPGAKLGWLGIGRFGLAFLKDVLGLGTHHVIKSGILFFLFFLAGANLLTFAIYHFSGRKAYAYWIFLLLYVTSNIWSYQVYFSVQQAEIACAMFLLVAAAVLVMQAFFEKKGVGRGWRIAAAEGLLVLGLGTYQALAAYYIAVCMLLFLVWLERTSEKEIRTVIGGIVGLLVTFGIAYVVYRVVADRWFMTTEAYMQEQMGWGRYPVTDCMKNVLRTAKNLLVGIGPRNFSFYLAGILLTAVSVVREWRRGHQAGRKWQFWLRVLVLAGLAASPLFMTLYMGEMLVTRAQFALPVAAAFLGMYAVGDGQRDTVGMVCGRWYMRFCMVCVLAAIVVQCGYNLRLTYTDMKRYASDVETTEELLVLLREENGGELPQQPVVFVGYRQAQLPEWCRRTEMYGWSFYEWDYSEMNPVGATHRIAGFVQAYTGVELKEGTEPADQRAAAEIAKTLADFPKKGCIAVTEEFVVVRLSEAVRPPETDWW